MLILAGGLLAGMDKGTTWISVACLTVRSDVSIHDGAEHRFRGCFHEVRRGGCGLERGNRLELPWLSGGVVQMGKALGVATPANAFVYTALKHYIDGRPADARTPKP